MNRTKIINTFIEKRNYNSYLEIGVAEGSNFESINIENKTGVDPSDEYKGNIYRMTSNEFFELNRNSLHKKYDIIFIDGLHLSGQVIKDVKNSLEVLSDNGVIVLHDCNPATEDNQVIPYKKGLWNGDVWKAVLYFRINLDGYDIFTVDADFGCGIIQKGSSKYSKKFIHKKPFEIDYNFFKKYRKEILNLISLKKFIKIV